MTRNEQKKIETEHVEYFLKLLNMCNFTVEADETPDFIIRHNDRIIGIEHTQIFRRSREGIPVLKINESHQDKIRAEVNKLCKDSLDYSLIINLGWHPSRVIANSDIHHISKTVYQLICDNIPPKDDSIVLKPPIVPECFHSLAIIHTHTVTGPNICMSRATCDETITTQAIIDIIDDKELKIDYIRTKCNEAWLLIVAEGAAPSSIANLEHEVYEYRFSSSFDCLYYLDLGNSKYYELKKHAV